MAPRLNASAISESHDGRRWYRVPYDSAPEDPFGTPELFLTGDFPDVAVVISHWLTALWQRLGEGNR